MFMLDILRKVLPNYEIKDNIGLHVLTDTHSG